MIGYRRVGVVGLHEMAGWKRLHCIDVWRRPVVPTAFNLDWPNSTTRGGFRPLCPSRGLAGVIANQ